jgi:hypothetical protein
MFGNILNNVARLAVNVVTTPVAVAADIVTVGGLLTDRDEPYILTQADKILDNLDHIIDDTFDDK